MGTAGCGVGGGGAAGCGWVVGGTIGRLRLSGHVQMQQSS